jgi:predicted O-linked N-acetylglucosamine transferase (SPINDLY family)
MDSSLNPAIEAEFFRTEGPSRCAYSETAPWRGTLTCVHETDQEIEQGLRLHRTGDLRAAAEIYQKILEQDPNQPDVLYLMGCLAHQTGNSSVAVGFLDKAILTRPDKAEYYYALGNTFTQLENYDLAEINLRQAIKLGSRPEFHESLGMLLKEQHRLGEAVVEFEAAAKLAADDADAHYNLGKAYLAAGQLLEATRSFEQTLKIWSGHIPALAALRKSHSAAKRSDEAVALLHQALAPLGGNADGLCDLADALQEAEDFEGAIEAYHLALALGSQSPRACYACGCAEIAREDFASAIACFEEAIRLRPEWLEARHNLARALYEMGQVSEAFEEFKVCAARKEDSARHARAMLALIAPGAPQADNQTVLEMRRAWVKDLQTDGLPFRATLAIRSASYKLKVGYVSSFFRSDNWMKPVWGLINQHDRESFDIYLFSDAPRSAILHGYDSNEADHYFDTTRLSNKALAELIQESGIEVLVDLNGYSEMNRLPMFLLRPAPVIVGWFNMYAPTGMPCFDYLVGDAEVIPAEEEIFYSERVQRPTGSYLSFGVDYPVPPVAELPSMRNSQFTFGCLGSQYKITSEVVEIWSRILRMNPDSRLLLKNKRLGTRAACEFLGNLFSKFGVTREQLQFEGPEDHFEFLRAYDRVDVALDTFPYNGGTTTTEAIWQGVPVIAFAGDRWASRTSASILRAGGLQEFVVNDVEEYISLACRLADSAEEKPRLADLRANMRKLLMASSVCDTRTFAREMEGIYRLCWKERSQK